MKYFFIINTSAIPQLETNPVAIDWLSRVKYRVTNITSLAGLRTLIAVRLDGLIEVPDPNYDVGTVEWINNPDYDPLASGLSNPDYDLESIFLQEGIINPNYVPGAMDDLILVSGTSQYIINPEYGEYIPNPVYNSNHITGIEYLSNLDSEEFILNPNFNEATANETMWITAEQYMNYLVNQGFITDYYTIEQVKEYINANWTPEPPVVVPPPVMYSRRYYLISDVPEFITIRQTLPDGSVNPDYNATLAGHVANFAQYCNRTDFYKDYSELRINNVGYIPRKVCVEVALYFDESIVQTGTAQEFVVSRLDAGVTNGFIREYYPLELRSGEIGDTIHDYLAANDAEWAGVV